MKKLVLCTLFLIVLLISGCPNEVKTVSESELKSKNQIIFDAFRNVINSDKNKTETENDSSEDGETSGSDWDEKPENDNYYGAVPLCPEIIGLDFSTCPFEKGRPVFIVDFGRNCVLGMKCDYKNSDNNECPDVWEPVCGFDGKTYENKCIAYLNNVEVAYPGECKNDNDCEDFYPEKPICDDGTMMTAIYDEKGCIIGFECGNYSDDCEDIKKPEDGFCINGKIVEIYDYNGCVIKYECSDK